MIRRLAPSGLGALAVLAGAPLYLLLDRLEVLPVSLRHAPWPIEALAAALALAAIGLALRRRARGSGRATIDLALGGAALAATVAFSVLARFELQALPPVAPELPVGRPLPALNLRDHNGRPFSLASLRGEPLVLILFRGVT